MSLLYLSQTLVPACFVVSALFVIARLVARYGAGRQQKALFGDDHERPTRLEPAKPTNLLESFPPQHGGPGVPDVLKRKHMPLTLPFDQQDPDMYSPTGYSVAEARSLFPFPDFAALTGVPAPEALPDFDWQKAQPRPYRPIRWAYHQTMSFSKLDPSYWLELTSSYQATIAQRLEIFQQTPDLVLQALPGSELACQEILHMALQFYTTRYPRLFTLSADQRVLYNHILSTQTDLATTPPLVALIHNIPEDFALAQRNPADGQYYFRAGVICSSLGWTVASKIGKALRDVHAPVPDYKAKMEKSMDRFFAKQPADKPIQRGSWSLEVGAPLFVPPGSPHDLARAAQDPALDVADVTLRVDWQSIRRLPISGAMVFNFKAIFTPLEKLRREKGVPGVMLRVLDEGKEALMKYKGTWHVEHVVKPALRAWAREQGDEQGDEVGTLDEYPFFEGWQAQWRADQGE